MAMFLVKGTLRHACCTHAVLSAVLHKRQPRCIIEIGTALLTKDLSTLRMRRLQVYGGTMAKLIATHAPGVNTHTYEIGVQSLGRRVQMLVYRNNLINVYKV